MRRCVGDFSGLAGHPNLQQAKKKKKGSKSQTHGRCLFKGNGLDRISNLFLLCRGPRLLLPVFCSASRSHVTVYTAMCAHQNISFHGLSGRSGNLHGRRTYGRPPACWPEPQSSNPGPALRQTSRREQGMIYSVAGPEIGELVKQKVLYGQPQSRNSLFNL